VNSTNSVPTILWLDPQSPLGTAEQAQLAAAGVQIIVIHTLDELEEALRRHQAMALALRQDTAYGLMPSVQALFKAAGDQLPVICRVEREPLSLAVDAMCQGAAYALAVDDWTAASWHAAVEVCQAATREQALRVLSTVVPTYRRRARRAEPAVQRSLVYVDPISRHLLALAQRVAQANVTALIEGPTGAGKEILARVLHEASPRSQGPFVGLNCAALPEQLIDDMLFGHEKGAFTGAQKDFRGLFEQAQGGTLFLDEIGEMPLHLQAKLLRVLQERQLTRLGSESTVLVDVRVIAATNKELRAAVAAREFREDLYFRISTFKLKVPPLSQRPGDILPLAAALLARHAAPGKSYSVTAQAQTQLLAYPWPGNVRELENVIQRAVVMCGGDCIDTPHLMFDDIHPEEGAAASLEPESLPQPPLSPPLPPMQAPETVPANLQAAVKSNEHQLILAAIQTTGSRIEAARKLGISPRTLRYKLAKLKDNAVAREAPAYS